MDQEKDRVVFEKSIALKISVPGDESGQYVRGEAGRTEDRTSGE